MSVFAHPLKSKIPGARDAGRAFPAVFRLGLALAAGSALAATMEIDRSLPSHEMPAIATIGEVLTMSGPEAAKGVPVRLEGVVIYADPIKGEVLFKDSTGVIPVQIDLRKDPIQPGKRAMLEGRTSATLIRYPDHPSGSQYLTSFESPVNVGTLYLARISGFLHPPRSGDYTFWIASDNGADLWLSPDENPANARKIALVGDIFSYTASRGWDSLPAQRSVKIHLRADQKYYIEALHWEEEGEDCLAVAWEGPDLARSVIDGEFLSSPGMDAKAGVSARGSILREFWLGYPFANPQDSDGVRNTQASVESILKAAPALFGKPAITQAHLTTLAGESLPEPRPISVEQAWEKEEDFQWVGVEGVVSQITDDGSFWTVIELSQQERRMVVRVANPQQLNLRAWLNARVGVRGFCAGAMTAKGARVASVLWVPSLQDIFPRDPQDEDWARLPVVALHDLKESEAPVRTGQRIRMTGRVLAGGPGQPLRVRDGVSRFSGFTSADGLNWTQIGDSIEIGMNYSVYAGIAVAGPSPGLCTATFDHTSRPLSPGSGVDVGKPPGPGDSQGNQAELVVTGGGNLGDKGVTDTTRDDFHFLSGRLEGDGEFVAHIAAIGPQSTPAPGVDAGIMIRETLDPDAKFTLLAVNSGYGSFFRIRRGTHNPTESFPQGNAFPCWLKLVRQSPPPIVVHAAQTLALSPDQAIEVMGVLGHTNQTWVLNEAFYRIAGDGSKRADEPVPARAEITTVQQIRQLSEEALGQFHPAKIRGVITVKTSDLYLEDETGGIRVPSLVWQKFGTFSAGQYIEIAGRAAPGGYSPALMPGQGTELTLLGMGRMPKPIIATWNQLMEGRDDAQWVEVRGVIRNIQGRNLKIHLPGGDLLVELGFDFRAGFARSLIDATVQIQGVCQVLANAKKQLVGIRLLVPAAEFIVVAEAPPADPFAVPAQTAGQLLQFDGQNEMRHRVKIDGVVTATGEGFFYLQDATGGVRVEATDATLQPGDRVEAVGFPDSSGFSINLTEVLLHKIGRGTRLEPLTLAPGTLPQALHSAKLIRMTAVFLGRSTLLNHEVLQFQSGGRVYQGTLPQAGGSLPEIETGSVVQLTGVCKVTGSRTGNFSASNAEFELLLSSPADLVVLRKPDWWTVGRILRIGGIFLGSLGLAAAWIAMILAKNRLLKTAKLELQKANEGLEGKVARRTADLAQANALLQVEIEERKRMQTEVERIHRELLVTSRQAGMAEVATSVLHNVGNVLNSVNVSATLVADQVRHSKAANLARVCTLLDRHQADLGAFLTTDPKGQIIPAYLGTLAGSLAAEQKSVIGELDYLQKNIQHIKDIVAMQQSYATNSGFTETISLPDLVEDALRINTGSLARHDVDLVRDYQARPVVTLDKHKVMQILINLVRNAKYACDESGRRDKQITVRITADERGVQVAVSDNGVGIPPENLTRIFAHGFTTRKTGHGFGLHSGALAAKELGGTLTVASAGTGHGATFTLELPALPENPAS